MLVLPQWAAVQIEVKTKSVWHVMSQEKNILQPLTHWKSTNAFLKSRFKIENNGKGGGGGRRQKIKIKMPGEIIRCKYEEKQIM